jgi:transketolase
MLNGDALETLRGRIFEISKKYGLSHIGSCVSALPIIYEIYKEKKDNDRFVLSCGHAGLALYVVMEKYDNMDAERLYKTMGVHPTQQAVIDPYVHCSTGSLGMGLTVACGMAQAEWDRNVYCLISDGECASGAIWESLYYIKNHLPNLKVYVNMNGFSATQEIDTGSLEYRLRSFLPTIQIRNSYSILPWSSGVDSHYYVMKEADHA